MAERQVWGGGDRRDATAVLWPFAVLDVPKNGDFGFFGQEGVKGVAFSGVKGLFFVG